jgi:hypothetical protein
MLGIDSLDAVRVSLTPPFALRVNDAVRYFPIAATGDAKSDAYADPPLEGMLGEIGLKRTPLGVKAGDDSLSLNM